MGWIDDKINSDEPITAKMLYNKFGFQHVVGIHLHARQAIAGPICVVATIIRPNHKFDLKPANKLSMTECNRLNEAIRRKSLMLNLGWVPVEVIPKIGIHNAIMSAINTCMAGVTRFNPPSIVIVDGFQMDPLPNGLRDSHTPVYTIRRGKERMDTIMAASIVGRVARTTMMKFMHDKYPEYDWANNEGFATKQHLDLIKEYGISPFHRDLSNVKSLQDFKAFPNERWRKEYENSYFGE